MGPLRRKIPPRARMAHKIAKLYTIQKPVGESLMGPQKSPPSRVQKPSIYRNKVKRCGTYSNSRKIQEKELFYDSVFRENLILNSTMYSVSSYFIYGTSKPVLIPARSLGTRKLVNTASPPPPPVPDWPGGVGRGVVYSQSH